ncbi:MULTISPECIES: lysozyme inhibitor LprI family protein [unclassified Pseudomonas]|uniref:lysozyme inhibitor LprI family protein n=1 Tax=unclassified Pseudomonas TaxID=196821 RepID=UPI000A1FB361|nr:MULTISPECIES: lysozyme inhibitor LprI family protein [unclassified Pseudomonas]
MFIKGSCVVSACALLFAQAAWASGMDCEKAQSVVEHAICADKPLYGLDAEMGSTYRKLIKAAPQAQAELKSSQRQWLKTRDGCADNIACLHQQYQDRLQTLNAQWIEAVAYKPDDVDREVMEDLHQRILKKIEDNPEFALEGALGTLSAKRDETSFSGDPSEDDAYDQTTFPKARPEGVSPDEWKALNASGLDADAEQGRATYTLIDLDGDGQRDLFVSTYSGGTGLVNIYETFHRDGARFTRRKAPYDPEAINDRYSLSTSDRGANQSVGWIESHGRMYLTYFNGSYGTDRLYLLNPLKINSQIPTVTVRYEYRLTVPATQYAEDNNASYTLEPGLQTALTEALTESNAGNPQQLKQGTAPLCPIPASGQGDDDYYSYGAGYYAIESVTDMAVTIGNECFIARLNNWFGSYSEKDGLPALLTLRKPGAGGQERSYSVNGRRRATEVSATIGKAEEGIGLF